MQASDYEPGAPPVFVMGYKTWRERFNGDLSLLDKTLVLNGAARTLIGIVPPRFAWNGADLWVPKKPAPGAKAEFWSFLGDGFGNASRRAAHRRSCSLLILKSGAVDQD